MRSILFVIGSLALVACAREPRHPAAVSQTEITNAKVPVAGENAYGPGDDSFGSSLSAYGNPSKGNLYPDSSQSNRQNPPTDVRTEPVRR